MIKSTATSFDLSQGSSSGSFTCKFDRCNGQTMFQNVKNIIEQYNNIPSVIFNSITLIISPSMRSSTIGESVNSTKMIFTKIATKNNMAKLHVPVNLIALHVLIFISKYRMNRFHLTDANHDFYYKSSLYKLCFNIV